MSDSENPEKVTTSRRTAIRLAAAGLSALLINPSSPKHEQESKSTTGKGETRNRSWLINNLGKLPPLFPEVELDFLQPPVSDAEAPFTEEQVTAEFNLRKYPHLWVINPYFTSPETPQAPFNTKLELLESKPIPDANGSTWEPNPYSIQGWLHKYIIQLYNYGSKVYDPIQLPPNWRKPPHSRLAIKEFWTNPNVMSVHSSFWWRLNPTTREIDAAQFKSSLQIYHELMVSGRYTPLQAQELAKQQATRIFLLKQPLSRHSKLGNTILPTDQEHLMGTLIHEQVIPIHQENSIMQLSSMVKDENGQTLYAMISCYPLLETNPTHRIIRWFKFDHIQSS